MSEYSSIEDVAGFIKAKLDALSNKKNIVALYAFNATGKTRLANILGEVEADTINTISYSAYLEDMFNWDNENCVLTFSPNSWIVKLVNEQGLEKDIIDNFRCIVNSKVEPIFDFVSGKVTFNIPTGGSGSVYNIKISKGEESMLIWSIFYTILETAIDALNTEESDRTTRVFDNLQYVIIDDPVSSIDDTKIISMAVKLIETIQSCKNRALKILITTHHALFYNVLVNSFKNDPRKNEYIFKSFSFSQNNYTYKLLEQNDSPFSYHLSVKAMVQNAIADDTLEKYHFNLFRNLLEKTANFLGYNNWYDCVSGSRKQEFTRLLNLYSHSKLSDLESREVSSEDRDIFEKTFSAFITDFKWNKKL